MKAKQEDEIKRQLDELIARYELEPELADIYVEGNTDKLLMEWFLEEQGLQYVTVYEIDTIDIPREKLSKISLDNNNRSRIIALALEMQHFSTISLRSSCIADKDFDYLFGTNYECDYLLFTDYSSMEMYLFNEKVIKKFLQLVVAVSQISAHNIIKYLSPILTELFLIRATNQSLKWGMTWLPFDTKKCIKLQGEEIDFSSKLFIEKYLNKNNKYSQKTIFINKLEELRLQSHSIPEIRCLIRGHDFPDVLYWYLKNLPKTQKKAKAFNSAETIRGSLLGCVEFEDLKQEKLFQRLLAWIKP